MSTIIQLPNAKPSQGMVDIYGGSRGKRGIDATLPIALADKILELIKAAGVPVRFDAADDRGELVQLRS